MEWIIAFITFVAGVVTIIWFIRDVRKENSKTLKAILEAEQNQTTALEKISAALERVSEMLMKAEQNQTTAYERISEMLMKAEQNQTTALEKISTAVEKTSTALERISEMLLNQTKILEKLTLK